MTQKYRQHNDKLPGDAKVLRHIRKSLGCTCSLVKSYKMSMIVQFPIIKRRQSMCNFKFIDKKVDRSTIDRCIRRYQESRSVFVKKKTGRRKKCIYRGEE